MKLALTILGLFGVLLVDAVPLSAQEKNYEALLEPEDLQDDLDDFMYLIPTKEIEDLFFEYAAEDEDVALALDYVFSEEFKTTLIEIESIPELKKFLGYLQKGGLDAYGFVNKINDMLAIEKIKPMMTMEAEESKQITGGLPGLIKDVEALLPVDKIRQLYYKKLESSKAFGSLLEQLRSGEFQTLVDKLMANPGLQNLIAKAEAKGVEVQAFLDFISSLLGIEFPARAALLKEEEVIDILKEIWSKVPMDELFNLILNYMIEDADFQDVVQYMLGEEFRNTQQDIEKLPEFKDLVKFFESVGMNVYEWIDNFHDLIGLPPIEHFPELAARITGGLQGMINDIRALLPLDELYAYYDEKIATSSKFREFVKRLETKELQNIVNALHKHKGFNAWLAKLEAKGVDLDELVEIVEAVIGIKFPPRQPEGL